MWPRLQLRGALCTRCRCHLTIYSLCLPNGIRAGAHQSTEQSRTRGLVNSWDSPGEGKGILFYYEKTHRRPRGHALWVPGHEQ